MIGLNIASYNEDSGDDGTWENVTAPEASIPDAEPVEVPSGGEETVQAPGLFDLARSISNRAYFRSRIRRSTAII